MKKDLLSITVKVFKVTVVEGSEEKEMRKLAKEFTDIDDEKRAINTRRWTRRTAPP